MKNKTLAVQRTLKTLRDNGWTACIVERFLPARGGMKFPRRIDAFGIGDLLAMHPKKGIYLIQCCAGTDHDKHKDKIMPLPERTQWKEAGKKGARVMLVSWALRGPKGSKGWKMREEEL